MKIKMDSDIGDANEWNEKASEYVESSRRNTLGQFLKAIDPTEEKKKETKPGQPTQYALYRDGYTTTTDTVESLPAGQYDITADSNAVYVVPVAPPTGILLELPEMRSEEVIKSVNRFWESEKDYKEGNDYVQGGAIYKAGIMIYGPPGSGKTSTIKIVNNKLIQSGGTVFYASGHPMTTMAWLGQFAKVEPNRKSIVILEDIDSLIQNYGESNYLEMLDSAKSVDNVLFIATTNYPERLDPRIYNRPGRFSHVIKIGMPTEAARKAFLEAILKKHDDVEYIVSNTRGFSVDHLTALVNSVYREKKELKNEIQRLKSLFRIESSSSDDAKIGFSNEKD